MTYPTLAASETIYPLDSTDWTLEWSENGGERKFSLACPNKRVHDALARLEDNFDGATCEAENHPEEVSALVGFYLDDRDDYTAREGFRYVAIVDDGTRAFLICEDCHGALLPKPAQVSA